MRHSGIKKDFPDKKNTLRLFKSQWRIFVLLAPGILCYLFFAYMPMVGIVTAFQDYNPFGGFFKSPFVGLRWFKEIIENSDFKQVSCIP